VEKVHVLQQRQEDVLPVRRLGQGFAGLADVLRLQGVWNRHVHRMRRERRPARNDLVSRVEFYVHLFNGKLNRLVTAKEISDSKERAKALQVFVFAKDQATILTILARLKLYDIASCFVLNSG
jgi:hypothetical protein